MAVVELNGEDPFPTSCKSPGSFLRVPWWSRTGGAAHTWQLSSRRFDVRRLLICSGGTLQHALATVAVEEILENQIAPDVNRSYLSKDFWARLTADSHWSACWSDSRRISFLGFR